MSNQYQQPGETLAHWVERVPTITRDELEDLFDIVGMDLSDFDDEYDLREQYTTSEVIYDWMGF